MSQIEFDFDEAKATQVVGVFIDEGGGFVDWYWLAKCLYALDREALRRWDQPVLGGDYRMLQYGPINQSAMDAFRPNRASLFWRSFERQGNELRMVENPGRDELSAAEVDLIREIVTAWKGLDFQAAHDKAVGVPECRGKQPVSWIATEEILRACGKTQAQIAEVESELAARSLIKSPRG